MKKEPESVALTSPDQREARLGELKRLFPDMFDGEGNLDEKALRDLAAPDGISTTERFRFEWAGKLQSKRKAFTPSRATLVADPERSVDFDNTQNMIIEGDNLETLKLLQTTYFERVKCIYIDPPYNTEKDFIYPDNYSESKKAYWQKNGTVKDGVKLTSVTEASGRKHSNWLNMMQSRLLLARQLLISHGVIFISIDDNEDYNLRRLCDEIFGETNFAGRINWRRRHNQPNDKTKMIAKVSESIIAYFKDIDDYKKTGVGKVELTGNFTNTDNDPRGDWATKPWKSGDGQTGSRYKITTPSDTVYDEEWMGEEATFKALLKDKRIVFTKNGEGFPRKKYFKSEREEEGQCAINWWPHDIYGHNQEASSSLAELFGKKNIFDNPKPVKLIKSILDLGFVQNGDIVMDFFAGSGVTADAVLQRKLLGIDAKYILVQLPEFIKEDEEAYALGYRTISQICIDRVKLTGKKVLKENPKIKVDAGFRVYRLADSHFPQNLFTPDPAKSDANNTAALEKHLKASRQGNLFGEETFNDIVAEISLKNGYGLFYDLEKLDSFPDNAVYKLTGNDKSTLLCLDNPLSEKTVDALQAYSDEQLIVARRALDTTKKWTLQSAFKDNLHTV